MALGQPYKITRKAILIGAPGSGKGRLHGVDNDLINTKQYYTSPRGGRFYDHEVVILNNPSVNQVIDEIHGSDKTYQTVYFSGHGYDDVDGHNICLRDANLPAELLFNNSSKYQMVIADSCRRYYHTISGLPKELEEYLYADGYSMAREIMDQYIFQSPPGKMLMLAASLNQYAIDNRDGKGGEFTLALLKGVYETKGHSGYQAIFPDQAMANAMYWLKQERQKQVPELINIEGNLQVPIGLASSTFLRQEVVETNRLQIQQQLERSRKMQNNQAAVCIGIAAIFLLTRFNQD
jgi:hypothetical protein